MPREPRAHPLAGSRFCNGTWSTKGVRGDRGRGEEFGVGPEDSGAEGGADGVHGEGGGAGRRGRHERREGPEELRHVGGETRHVGGVGRRPRRRRGRASAAGWRRSRRR
eukprot:TRINITY_DN15792_c0_g1_i1.p5 TRINITY_DN15792_c0_g1~~TRINITY_DN15792_c0_g1_i1.p5  ORF type:complete len:109 (-),score=4.83 TRINITY_DN15792_c0_g1_i1:257-583(-)